MEAHVILMEIIKKYKFLILALLVSLASVYSLFGSGLPPTHDGEYHVIRFYEFYNALSGGDLYPRWAADLNNGFGVPLFNYVYPLPNYVASFLHLFGIGFIDSFKISLAVATVLGAGFFYLWTRIFWGNLGGLVSSVFYTFSPYHLLDIYIRGSVGEVWALAIFPAFLWSTTVYIKTKKPIFFPLSSVLFALLIFSHNILALMFSAFLISYVIFLIYKEKDKRSLIYKYTSILVIGLGLSSVFWLPALLEKNYVVGLEIYDIANNFPYLYELLFPSWGSGFSEGSLGNKLSFQIGIANLLVIFASIIVVFLSKPRIHDLTVGALGRFASRCSMNPRSPASLREAGRADDRGIVVRGKRKDNNKSLFIFFILSFFFVFFLMMESSKFIWDNVPLMNYFQFPWRFLSLQILICSFLAGGVIYFGKAKKILAGVLISMAILLGIGYAKPAHFLERNDAYYITRSNFIDGTNSPGNTFNTVWFRGAEKKQNKLTLAQGSADIEIKSVKNSYYSAEIKADEDSSVIVNTAYFPGWGVWIDGKKTNIEKTEKGLFAFNIKQGVHDVEVRLENTPIQQAGIFGFFVSITVLLLLFGKAIFVTIKK
ncbi:MAG: 6-pyruvoyl-tetrahydropterin synthase-related protein [Candidatus Levyibacteriota bacterium]